MTSGGPSPNQESPDSELAGSARSMRGLDEPSVRISAPINGATPMTNVLALLNSCSAVVDRRGDTR